MGRSSGKTAEGVDIETLSKVKEGDGPDLVIQGSSTLYPQLLEAGLIDELR